MGEGRGYGETWAGRSCRVGWFFYSRDSVRQEGCRQKASGRGREGLGQVAEGEVGKFFGTSLVEGPLCLHSETSQLGPLLILCLHETSRRQRDEDEGKSL